MEEYLRDDVEALKAWGTWYENGVHSNFLMKTFVRRTKWLITTIIIVVVVIVTTIK